LRQNLRALLFHQAEPSDPVRAHPGHDYSQGTIGIEVCDGPEQVIHRWFTIIFRWVVSHQEVRALLLAQGLTKEQAIEKLLSTADAVPCGANSEHCRGRLNVARATGAKP